MVRALLLLFFILFTISGKAQDENQSFSEALAMHLPKYTSNAQDAYRSNDVERAEFLFDSLVNNCLKGSYLDNFKVRSLNNRIFPFDDIKKPLYLITKASWVVPTKGEIPALNELAEKYHDKIDFVVLFWNDRKTTKQFAKQYHKSIKVLYVDELGNESNYVIKNLKHSLGVPTSFLLDDEKKIVDIRRNVAHPYGVKSDESFEINHKAFSEGISRLLIHDTTELSQHSPGGKLP